MAIKKGLTHTKVREFVNKTLRRMVKDYTKHGNLVMCEVSRSSLSCTETRWVNGDDGDSWWQCVVEGASPEAYDLSNEIAGCFSKKFNGRRLEVLPEW